MDKNVFLKEALKDNNDVLIGKIIVVDRNGREVNIDNHISEMENIMNTLSMISMKDLVSDMKSFNNGKNEFGTIISDSHKHDYKKLLSKARFYRSDIIKNVRFNQDPAGLIINCVVISKNNGDLTLEHTRLNTSVSGDINNLNRRVPIKTSNNANIIKVVEEVIDKMSEEPNNPRKQFELIENHIKNSDIGIGKEKNSEILGWD